MVKRALHRNVKLVRDQAYEVEKYNGLLLFEDLNYLGDGGYSFTNLPMIYFY